MLNKAAIQNIQLLKKTIDQVWGSDAKLGEIQVLDVPVPMFQTTLELYDRFLVQLEYDRSTLDIQISTGEGYKGLHQLTDEKVFFGYDNMIPENLLHNLQVLDRFLVRYMNIAR